MKTVKLTQQREKDLRYIKATMAMEDMPLTERDTADVRDCLSGEVSADEKIKQLVAQYTVKVMK
ncbi:MAG: antitoxin VbhA family protein [Peptococcaceae bacterium]|nr:antitoxin VbhA family protein [Peptococcaceae bacterium]